MKNRTLTDAEIGELYEFCYTQSVVHYDVQAELVDHLASAIETRWEQNPQLGFDDALYEVNAQFGGHAGFVIIRQEKEKALRKEYNRLLWRYVSEFFKLPKIVVTALISLLTYGLLEYSTNDAWVIGPLLVLVAAFSFYFLYFYFPKHIKIKRDGAAFLLNEVLQRGVAHKTIITSGAILGISARLTDLSTVENIVFSILFSLYLVLLYGDCFYVPKKVKEHFEEQFPQFKLA